MSDGDALSLSDSHEDTVAQPVVLMEDNASFIRSRGAAAKRSVANPAVFIDSPVRRLISP